MSEGTAVITGFIKSVAVITTGEETAEQPLVFVTVTVYDPDAETVIDWVVAPLLHK